MSKVFLTINNTPTHPPAEALYKIHDDFEVIVHLMLQLNNTYQRVFDKLKRMSKK